MSKKKFYKRWWFWLIAIIVVGGIAAGSGEDKAKKVSSNENIKTSSKEEVKESKKTETFKVGDTIEIKDFKVTVNKVTTSSGGEFLKPKDGNEFLNVDITLDNISDQAQHVSSILMFKVVDKDGRAYSQAITENQNGQLDGEIGAGRKMTGEYVVEVPKGTVGLQLEFDSSLLSSGQVVVDLN